MGLSTVIYLSLKVLGFVSDDDGSEFVTLNRKVAGSDNCVVGVR
jgi:hypothetical protein